MLKVKLQAADANKAKGKEAMCICVLPKYLEIEDSLLIFILHWELITLLYTHFSECP